MKRIIAIFPIVLILLNISGCYHGTSSSGTNPVKADPFRYMMVNETLTPLQVTVHGWNMRTIPSGDTTTFQYTANPGTVIFQCVAKVTAYPDQVLGLTLIAKDTIAVDTVDMYGTSIYVSESYFILYMKNYFTTPIDTVIVNYQTTVADTVNWLIPADRQPWILGYHRATDSTTVYAHFLDNAETSLLWHHGTEFNFPDSMNQAVTLNADPR